MSEAALAAITSVIVAGIAAYGAVKAAAAERNSKPVSNGFADGVNRKLDRLEQLLIEHYRDHSK